MDTSRGLHRAASAHTDEPAAGLDVTVLLSDKDVFEQKLDEQTPIAVTGPPFSGRKQVLEYAKSHLGASRIRLTPAGSPDKVTAALKEDRPLIIEDCQHLSRREIGGFDTLETVLNAIARTDTKVVTGWNSYAWSYLDAVADVGSSLERVELSPLSRTSLIEFIRTEAGPLPECRVDELNDTVVSFDRLSLGWRGIELAIPRVDKAVIKTRLTSQTDPESIVFEYLTSETNGNPGVALAIWQQSCVGDDVRPGDIDVPSVDVGKEGAFLLRLLLCQERVEKAFLADRIGGRLNQLLGELTRKEIETPGDTAVVVPNDVMFTTNIANANDGNPEMLVTIEVAISPSADVTTAMDILKDALVTSPYVYVDTDHPVSVRVSDQVSYRRIRGRGYVADLRDGQAFASGVTRRTLEAYENQGIETPENPALHGLQQPENEN